MEKERRSSGQMDVLLSATWLFPCFDVRLDSCTDGFRHHTGIHTKGHVHEELLSSKESPNSDQGHTVEGQRGQEVGESKRPRTLPYGS